MSLGSKVTQVTLCKSISRHLCQPKQVSVLVNISESCHSMCLLSSVFKRTCKVSFGLDKLFKVM